MRTIREAWTAMWARLRGEERGAQPANGKGVEAVQQKRVERILDKLAGETIDMRLTLELLSDRTANIQRSDSSGGPEGGKQE